MRTGKVSVFISLFIAVFYSCSLSADDEEGPGNDSATSDLAWEGEMEKFTINPRQGVHLNDPHGEAGTAYVTFPWPTVRDTRWELGVRLTFNPSISNYARFYLASSSPTLSGDLNGYFVQIGGVKDNVGLYQQIGNERILLISGRELMKGDNSPQLHIKVECDKNGYWTLWTRSETECGYTLEKQIKENSIQSSVCCGVYCLYTKTRSKDFTFHHIQVSNGVETTTEPDDIPDDTPDDPAIPALPDDVSGMLLFNEIMYHNANDGAEYVEIYNPTGQDITLPAIYLYKMDENGTVFHTTVLRNENPPGPLTIPSKEYLCFTKYANQLKRKHKVDEKNLLEISKFPTLNNNEGYLALSSSPEPAKGCTFDACHFWDEWHDTSKKTTGVSLEKKSPELSSLSKNWHSSKDASGGTPGRENSGSTASGK